VSEQRFAERRRRAGRRRVLRWLAAVAGVAAVGGLVWLVWFSDVLGVRTVDVEGLTTMKPAQVREAADLVVGTPLARVDTDAAAARVARLERVEHVDVERSWPRTVTVVVRERTAVAWTRVDGDIRLLDRFGVDFRTVSKAPKGLVEVATTATDPRRRQLAVVAAASVVSRLRADAPALMKQVQAVDAPTRDAVTLDLTRGRTVTWGSAAKAEQKITVLEALLKIDAKGYDVSAPEQPTTRD
jgi:cell division protein FtsQ